MTDRPLPETIPAGTYMLVPGDKRTTGLQITKRTPMHRSGWFVNATGCDLTEAQARHLIAMPGRPHDDRLDGPGCGGGSDAEHCSCWLNEEKPCCRCRYDGDEAITCVSAPDPTRAHWTEAQRQPGEKRGMRRPDKDGGGRYLDHAALSDHLVTLAEKPGDLIDAQPIAPDGTVPVERES